MTAEPRELAEKAMERGTFTLTDMLQDRTFPELDVPLYLDEAGALKMIELTEEIAKLETKLAYLPAGTEETTVATARVKELETELASVRESMNDKKYIATIRGFSNADRKLLVDGVMEEFPIRYEVGEKNAFTGKAERTEVPNPDRDTVFISRLWSKFIVRLTNSTGAVLEGITVEEAAQLRYMLPTTTMEHLDAATQKIQVASDWYEGLTDEVF